MSKSKRRKIKLMLLEKCKDKKCPWCRLPFSMDYGDPRFPTIDHRVPKSKGGSDDLGNLSLLCRGCNELKGSKVLV